MAGKFELTKNASGHYHFNLKASNGQIIASSEMYNSKASALNGIESIRNHGRRGHRGRPDGLIRRRGSSEVRPTARAGQRWMLTGLCGVMRS